MHKQSIIAGWLALALLIYGTASALSDYDQSRKIFESTAEKLNSEFDLQQAAALKQYQANLEAVNAMLQSRGDLQSLLAVRQESERFSKTGTVEDDAELPAPIISKVREYYYDSISRADDYRKQRYIALSKKWLEYLEKTKVQLTKQGKMDEAGKIHDEAEQLLKEILAIEAGFPPDTETELSQCPVCRGKGYSTSECKTCARSKKCRSCKGSGKKKGLNDNLRPCVSCKGTGKCRICDGMGEIRTICSKCNGEKTIRVAVQKPPEEETAEVASAAEQAPPPLPEEPTAGAVVESELNEYIDNMKTLYEAYKKQDYKEASLEDVKSDPGKYVGILLSSKVRLNQAFPRGVYVSTDKSGGQDTKLMPYSHSVGNSATRLLKNKGKASEANIIYGLVNKDNFTLLHIDAP